MGSHHRPVPKPGNSRMVVVHSYVFNGPTSLNNTLQFADDQVVLAGDKEDLEYMTHILKETYEKWGLDMNFNKTKYLCVGGTHNKNEIRQRQ